jgi:hypothetical protein
MRAARRALAARDVRIHGAAVAGLKLTYAVAGPDYFHGKLVPQNPWISEKGLRAFECVKICAADSDGQHAYEYFTRPRRARLRSIGEGESPRLFQHHCLHGK